MLLDPTPCMYLDPTSSPSQVAASPEAATVDAGQIWEPFSRPHSDRQRSIYEPRAWTQSMHATSMFIAQTPQYTFNPSININVHSTNN